MTQARRRGGLGAESGLMLRIAVIFALMSLILAFATAAIRNLAVPALRSGTLQARGRTYSRASEPIRYWSGILFWICLFALSLLGFVLAAADIVRLVTGRM